jgi:hypothetical protein
MTKTHGQALVEYVVVLLFAVIVLTVPWGGHPAPIQQLVNALRLLYTSYAYTISLP